MELWRKAANPWGQDVLIGVSWDLMWAAIIASVLFAVGHAVWIRTRPAEELSGVDEAPAGVPDRIQRHSMASRIFHWTMSASMIVLLITAFVPVIGLQFAWVEIHWIAGVVLTATVVYHVIRSVGWQDYWAMMQLNVEEGIATLKHVASAKAPAPPKSGKYPFDHRLFHHGMVVVGLGVIATGLLMMVRIDTPFWARNPYMLSDSLWGVVYVAHGLCGVALILMTASHIYFAIRPEKRWMLWSMVQGWIDREHYVAHFDPEKWVVGEVGSGESVSGAVADGSVSTPLEDQV
jgi:formate dehydrogenase subunit gamma